jgi:hypothetical protein
VFKLIEKITTKITPYGQGLTPAHQNVPPLYRGELASFSLLEGSPMGGVKKKYQKKSIV